MGKIITVAHQKGGVGKSTLAMNLAVCFQDQLNVALVDTDLQGSLFQIKEELPGLAVVGNNQLQDIKKLDYDLIIVDTPPYLSNNLPELFSLSSYVAAVNDTMNILMGKWKLPIMASLSYGKKRFKELEKTIPKITPRMLSKELRELELNGVVTRTVYDSIPVVIEYALTKSGQSFSNVVDGMLAWGY